MKPVKLNLEIYRGDTYYREFQWREFDVAVDITGCSIKMQFRECLGSPDVLLEASSVDGKVSVTDGINGGWEIDLPPAETSLLEVGKYVYDVKFTFPDSSIHTVIRGIVDVVDRVTV